VKRRLAGANFPGWHVNRVNNQTRQPSEKYSIPFCGQMDSNTGISPPDRDIGITPPCTRDIRSPANSENHA